MSLTRLAAAALLPVAVLGSGLSIPDDNRMVQEDGLIRFPVLPKEGSSPFGRNSNATKRQVGTDSFYKRSGTMYIIELTLGTPGQTVPVQFDTGSSELWVNPVCSKSTTPAFCDAQPRFTDSTTIYDLNAQGEITYGTGYAKFEYVADYVAIGCKSSWTCPAVVPGRIIATWVLTRDDDAYYSGQDHPAVLWRRLRQCPRRRGHHGRRAQSVWLG